VSLDRVRQSLHETLTYQAVNDLRQHVEQIWEAVQYGHTKTALYKVADINDALANLAAELVAEGVSEGMSQAEMARCMDIPASALRGAKRELSRA
jgi:hypothetical protein